MATSKRTLRIELSPDFRGAVRALRRWEVVRWLVLLEATDLLGDVLYGFVALYFVDVVKVDPVVAGLAVVVLGASGMAGDVLLLPLLAPVALVLGLPSAVESRGSTRPR